MGRGLITDRTANLWENRTPLHPRAANELTITEWDPASKQPLYKVGAVRVTKIADAGGTPSAAPTTTASAPISGVSVPATAGGEDAEVKESVAKEV